ncbi:hypothetical protein [Alphaentomopoxvirus acuprea]|uniref:Uncharacterized protein n=1 Tax=Alphaentomopoxvirus acuprea TaxID=62099 RepID=W6JIR0_9POXV|nr:hypothetical protein BA82_gp082 [Anomala cuprea entomopoxvirus]BAO49442.1 hypothetical protein [Anomala cuprea entomopoxvirus]
METKLENSILSENEFKNTIIADKVYIKNKFYIDNNEYTSEIANLDGEYAIQNITNDREDINNMEENRNLHCKLIFTCGNILYNTNTPDIDELIEIMIKYTYGDVEESLQLDYSCKQLDTMREGTICPSREVCFKYNNKIFILYGRYIFGYNNPFITFSHNLFEEEEYIKLSKAYRKLIQYDKISLIRQHLILLPDVFDGQEYNYAFKILDANTEILDAFGLYT